MGEKQRGEIILIAITSNRVKNKVEKKKISRDKIIGWNLYLTIVKQIRKISRKIVARSLLESGRIFKWDTHMRFETYPRRWFYRSIFFSFFFFFCIRGATVSGVIKVCSLRRGPVRIMDGRKREREKVNEKEGGVDKGVKREGAMWVERSCYTQSVSSLCDVLASFSRLV